MPMQDVACTLPEKELVNYLTWLGPLGRVLHDADERVHTQVIETVRAAFDPYVHGDEGGFDAPWIVGAPTAILVGRAEGVEQMTEAADFLIGMGATASGASNGPATRLSAPR
jgi:hypothetical protein